MAEHPNEFPLPFTKQMRELANLIDDFYEDWPAGGALHIVLDDWNLEDEDIAWCLGHIESDRRDERIKPIADGLLRLSMAERYKVLNGG